MKWTVFIIALLTLPAVVASNVTIYGGVGLNISYGMNDSFGNGTVWWPEGSYNFAPSQNFTGNWTFGLVCEQPDFLNETTGLGPGETGTYPGCWENLSVLCADNCSNATATCTNTTTVVYQNQTCSVDRAMNVGDQYYKNDAGCALNFTCGWNGELNASNSYSFLEDIILSKNGNLLTVTGGNGSSNYLDLSQLNDTVTQTVNLTCPVVPFDQVSNWTAQQGWNYCTQFFPLIADWLNLTIYKCVDGTTAFRDYVTTQDAWKDQSNQALSDCRAQNALTNGTVAQCQAEVAGLQSNLLAAQDENSNLTAGIIVESILLALAVIAIVLLAIRDGEGI